MRRQRLDPHPVTGAAALPLERMLVAECLDTEKPSDSTFKTAFDGSLAALGPAARTGALAGITGHVAESVIEMVLAGFGWTPVRSSSPPARTRARARARERWAFPAGR